MTLGQEGGRNPPDIEVQFDRPSRRYEPGNQLVVRYRIRGVDPGSVRAVETSVAWYTEGKGEEDLFVHAFERIIDRTAIPATLDAGSLETSLPPSPLSYEGVIVKLRWCVRIRVFFTGGRDYVSEHVFEVGSIPPATVPVATEDVP